MGGVGVGVGVIVVSKRECPQWLDGRDGHVARRKCNRSDARNSHFLAS